MSDMIPRDEGKQWGAIQRLEGKVDTSIARAEGEFNLINQTLHGVSKDMSAVQDCQASMRKDIDELVHELAGLDNSMVQGFARVEARMDKMETWGRNLWEKERYLPGMCLGTDVANKVRSDLEPRIAKLEGQKTEDDAERWKKIVKWGLGILGTIITAYILANGNEILWRILGGVKP